MKKMWLVTVAAAALSLPAMAQNAPTQQPNNNGAQMNQSDQTNQSDQMKQPEQQQGNQQDQMQQGSQADQSSPGQQQASERIDPTHLQKDQIKQIQQALDQKGFKTQEDGIWGPKTASAVRKFQEQNKIEGKGSLNQQTLAKLGVNLGGQTPSETTGAGPKQDTSPNVNANPPSQNESNPSQPSGGANEKPMNPPNDTSGSQGQPK
jgi:peptidoglycan hydrolase-like protein with peptidoglycan-binding domain